MRRSTPFELQAYSHVDQMGHAKQPTAEPVGDPDIALAVDAKTATVESGLEVLDLARIGGGEARDVVDAAIGHPDPVLLVDAEVERRSERFARLCVCRPRKRSGPWSDRPWENRRVGLFEMPTAQTSPLGVTMIPCIRPSRPLKLMPSGGVRGLPFLSNTAMDLLP